MVAVPVAAGVGAAVDLALGADDNQRSEEYDTVSERYGRFLLTEIMPITLRTCPNISADPARRTVMGVSSGAIASFTACWHFPEAFGNAISHCGGPTCCLPCCSSRTACITA